jgi:hypothetical protein
MPHKGDTSDVIDSQFLKQDRYRKKQIRTNTYDIFDKRNDVKYGKRMRAKSHAYGKSIKKKIYKAIFFEKVVVEVF